MARTTIEHTVRGTVAHGVIIENGQAKPATFEIDGCTLSAKSAQTRVRNTLNNTFCIDLENPVTYYGKVYSMPVSEFINHAQLIDISEK